MRMTALKQNAWLAGAALLLPILLGGCKDSAQEVSFPVLPPGLADCKFYVLQNSGGTQITVARCPNSATTTNYTKGKSRETVIVVDGVQYEKMSASQPQ